MKKTFAITIMAFLTMACQQNPAVTQKTAGGVYQGTSPNQRVSNRTELARVRTAMAGQLIKEHKLDEAQRQLELAFNADARYAPAYDMMGNLLRAEGSPANLKKADEFFRRSIAIDPKNAQARNNYGVYLSQMGRYNDAINNFNIAANTLGYEDRASALENLGRTYLLVGHTRPAEEAFVRALDINPSTIIARVEMIDILIDQKRTLQAKEYYDSLKSLFQAHGQPLPPRLAYQGVRLSILQNNPQERQTLSTLLLSQYPLSDEAKKLKTWLNNPVGVPKK